VELQHSFTVPAGVEKAWATLLDLEGVAPCFPGATLTGKNGDEFTGQVKVKLGPVSLQYAGKGRFVERDDADHHAVIEAHGSDRRGNGTAGATVIAHLESEGDEVTRVAVATQLKVTGRPAQFGRGVMQDVGSRIVDQFADALARKLAGGSQAPAAAPASANGTTAPVAEPVVTPAHEPVVAPTPAVASVAGPAASAAPSGTSVDTATRPSEPCTAPVTRLAPGPSSELDLNTVVLPVLARQYGPTLLAVLVTAVITWAIARRRH
jgi:carbon monoxide dehydrogenase subunit G